MRAPACVLVLAGLDPSGKAGIIADAEAIRASGAWPLCVPTALTVQSARGRALEPVEQRFLLEAARALLAEEPVGAIKIGMVGSPRIARALGQLAAEAGGLPLVLDPVVRASSGMSLFRGTEGEARQALRALLPGAIVTPNLFEAGLLLELSEAPAGPRGQEAAGRALVDLGARAALVKGGHGEGPESVDVLVERDRVLELRAPRLPGTARGTGCRLASALAAGLARGLALEEATQAARALVRNHIASSLV